MKSSEELVKYRELDEQTLQERLNEMEQALMNLRFRKASGQLESSASIKSLKQSIARANTVARERKAFAQSANV